MRLKARINTSFIIHPQEKTVSFLQSCLDERDTPFNSIEYHPTEGFKVFWQEWQKRDYLIDLYLNRDINVPLKESKKIIH